MIRSAPMKRTGFAAKQRKPMPRTSRKKAAYRASKDGRAAMDHMRAVKALPCVACGAPGPSDAHHVIHDRHSAAKASDWDVIPLCPECHRYPHRGAIHTDKATWRERHGPDHGFLAAVRRMLARQ